MRKIILSLIILFSIICKVEAREIYYSDYSDFSDFSLEKIDSSELVNVQVERRFRWFREEKVGEYRNILGNNTSFKFVDMSNSMAGQFSEWSEEEPSLEQNRVIETKVAYKIKRPKPIRNISIVNTLPGVLGIDNVDIYYMDKKIDYEMYFDCADEDLNISYTGSIKIDLNEYYDLQKIKVIISGIEYNNVEEFTVLASVPSSDNTYQIVYYSTNITDGNNNVELTADDWIGASVKYYEEELVLEKPDNESLTKIQEVNLYRYQDPLFYFYNINKKYIDGYFVNYPNFIKDESDYKDYYRYQVRDKIEISKDILITDYNQLLSDFVNSTTDYEINTNLNINKNGQYDVEFITPFIKVYKLATVNIEENKEKETIEDLQEELNKLRNDYQEKEIELNNITNKYDKLLSEYEGKQKELNDIRKEYSNSLGDYQKKEIELSNKYNSLLDEYKKKETELDSIRNDYNNLLEEYLENKNQLNDIKNRYSDILSDFKNKDNELNEMNNKYNYLIEQSKRDENEFTTKYNSLLKDYESKKVELNDITVSYNNLLENYYNLKEESDSIKEKYNLLLKSYEKEQSNYNNDKIKCEEKLGEVLLKVEDSDKKLKLSEEANKYLQKSLLKINNNDSFKVNGMNLFWFICFLTLLLILSIIFLKKLSNKKKN